MSKFASGTINCVSPYIPGEQPSGHEYVKLNTNENPYYVSPSALEKFNENAARRLNRYSDPESMLLTKSIADYYGVENDNVLPTNGSDEALAFCFIAYCVNGVCYPDVTYGFYDTVAKLFNCAVEHIALQDDFTIKAEQYFNKGKTIILANPNAQTGILLKREKLTEILENNADNVVIVDQAYADFGKYNAVELLKDYPNLVTVNTFSKSRSLAGARVGFVIADKCLIDDLKKVKNSFHPYNVNTMSATLAAAVISDKQYFKENVSKIIANREKLIYELKKLKFYVLPSDANFVLAKSNKFAGDALYKLLKEKGVLVRHFNDERIKDFVRITVGTENEINILIDRLKEIGA